MIEYVYILHIILHYLHFNSLEDFYFLRKRYFLYNTFLVLFEYITCPYVNLFLIIPHYKTRHYILQLFLLLSILNYEHPNKPIQRLLFYNFFGFVLFLKEKIKQYFVEKFES